MKGKGKQGGIDSAQKSEYWLLAPLGGFFFVVGTYVSITSLPDALSKDEYSELFVLIFVFGGAGLLYMAFSGIQAYRRFGPTPLFLDPPLPGVGGQLGGRFSIYTKNVEPCASSTTELWVRLVCTRHTRRRSCSCSNKKSGSPEILSDIGCPVYLTQNAQGLDAEFVFNIPDSCIPTQKNTKAISTSGRSKLRITVDWKLIVEGDFSTSGLGKFTRTWKIDVGENAAQVIQDFNSVQNFQRESKKNLEDRAITSILDRVLVTGDSKCINVNSKPGQAANGGKETLLIGAVTCLIGSLIIIENSWLFGALFALIGGYVFLHVLYHLGKSIEVKFDKRSRLLATNESWFGHVYARHQSNVLDPDQFSIRLTSVVIRNNKKTELYAVEFKSENKAIRLADNIEGKTTALVLLEAIAAP